MTKIKCCKKKKVQDLTQGLGPVRHYICKSCKSHLYKDKFYTKKEWDSWINSPDDTSVGC